MAAQVNHVLVTGAARGLGFELTKMLLRAGGYHVIAAAGRSSWGNSVARNQQELKLVAEQATVPTKKASGLTFVSVDVADPQSRTKLLDKLTSVLGTQRLHTIVNNAGVYPAGWTEADFKQAINTNCIGPLALADELNPLLASGSHVVNVTSGFGLLRYCSPHYRQVLAAATDIDGLAGSLKFVADDAQGASASGRPAEVPAYKVSKAGLNRGTQLLAEAWAGSVRVNSVDPGWCKTDMGGAGAPRSAVDGARSIFHVIAGQPSYIGTGRNYSTEGKVIGWE